MLQDDLTLFVNIGLKCVFINLFALKSYINVQMTCYFLLVIEGDGGPPNSIQLEELRKDELTDTDELILCVVAMIPHFNVEVVLKSPMELKMVLKFWLFASSFDNLSLKSLVSKAKNTEWGHFYNHLGVTDEVGFLRLNMDCASVKHSW